MLQSMGLQRVRHDRVTELKVLFRSVKGGSLTLPFFIEGSNHLCATGVVSSTDATLVILQLRANDAITACPHTLPPDTHGIAIWPAFCSIGHLNKRNTLAVGNTGSAYVISLIKSSFNLGLLSLIGIDFISETKQPKKEK